MSVEANAWAGPWQRAKALDAALKLAEIRAKHSPAQVREILDEAEVLATANVYEEYIRGRRAPTV